MSNERLNGSPAHYRNLGECFEMLNTLSNDEFKHLLEICSDQEKELATCLRSEQY